MGINRSSNMPAVKTGTVAVTGANGFVASHIVNALLDAGFTVRACVRDPSNENNVGHLKTLQGADRLTLHAGDLLKAGSYDEAFAGCDAVVHAAAVVDIESKGAEAEAKVVQPSLLGTQNVLASVNAAGSVKRVVHTSSIAAILRADESEDHIFSEEDWNTYGTVNNGDAYGYAKQKAEKCLHETAASDETTWDWVSINPHVILGPVMCKEHTKSSAALIRQMIYGNKINNYNAKFVDVRDVARAHVEGLMREEAGGQRFLLINDSPCMNTTDLIPMVQHLPFPMDSAPLHGSTGAWMGYKFGMVSEYAYFMFTKKLEFTNSKSKEVLGMEYKPLGDTLEDCAKSMVDGGYIKARKQSAPRSCCLM